jgi:DNA repair photolyase
VNPPNREDGFNESENLLLDRLNEAQQSKLHPALQDPIEYRKSGLSLNHIIGCPLDCAYCVRHLFGNFAMKKPKLLMSDGEAVDRLLKHRFFQTGITPLQILNRATDPFLPSVKPHLFAVLHKLDERQLTNHVLVITRFRVSAEDCRVLNQISNLRLTLLFTFSGIDDANVEPVDSNIAASSLKCAFANADRYRTVLYWRPIVAGLNDSDEHIERAIDLSNYAHATVFTGLFYRDEIRRFFRDRDLTDLYPEIARRKILPQELDARIVEAFRSANHAGTIFRKTSCAVAYAHSTHDYNGHFGIRELCDICPMEQIDRCQKAWAKPKADVVRMLAFNLGAQKPPVIDDRAIQVEGLDEQRRYFIQHSLGYQVHDVRYPHQTHQHGRANIGSKEQN